MALAALVMAAAPDAFAQENGNRDEYGKVVRGPYETNRFGDNWFIGAAGGANVFWSDRAKIDFAPSVDGFVGKWFTPSVGTRVGYQGFQSKMWADTPSVLGNVLDNDKDMYQRKFGYMYIHGDFLWNMSNALGGYKETRFWNFIPYLHAGYYRSYGLDDADFVNNELAMGAGLLHNLRLADRLDLIIDMRATVVNGRAADSSDPSILGSVTAGLAVDLGWPGFVRTSSVMDAAAIAAAEQITVLETAAVAMEAANAALALENKKLMSDNNRLSNEVKKLKAADVPAVPDIADFFDGMTPAVYFEIGQTVLSPLEMKHLEFIAESLVAKADGSSRIVITVLGTADSNTGSVKRNQQLSEARGKYVYDMLVNKYGIDQNRLILTSDVVKATGNPALDRAVIFTF